jgi:hypothetical protein
MDLSKTKVINLVVITTFLFVIIQLSGCTTMTPLTSAAKEGDVAMINKLLDEGARVDEPSQGNWKVPPLGWALTYILLTRGAPVYYINTLEATPLHLALCCKNVELSFLEHLIQKGADVNHKDKIGLTSLHYIPIYGNIGNGDVVIILIDKGADVNARDITGATPLMTAARYNSLPMTKLLLERGADVNATDIKNKNALSYAKNEEITQLLLNSARIRQEYLAHESMLQVKDGAKVESIAELRKAAEAGNAAAQYKLGVAYQIGNGVEKNAEEAAKWFRMSADRIMSTKPPGDSAATAGQTKAKAGEEPKPKDKSKPTRQNIRPSGYTLEAEPIVSCLKKGEFESAFSYANQIYKNPGMPKQNRYLALLERGKLALATRKYDQCIADLQRSRKTFSDNRRDVQHYRGIGLARHGRHRPGVRTGNA